MVTHRTPVRFGFVAVAVLVVAGCWSARPTPSDTPSAQVSSTPLPSTTPIPSPSPTPVIPETYTAAEWAYFAEVAVGAEIGGDGHIHKWGDDITVSVFGSPTEDDLASLDATLDSINDWIDPLTISIVDDTTGNMRIYFSPTSEFSSILEDDVPDTNGYFAVWWGRSGTIVNAVVLESTDGVDQEARNHLIREEIGGALGLMSDSYTYADSIFYEPWTTTQDFSAMDGAITRLLYAPQIQSGMTLEEAKEAMGVS